MYAEAEALGETLHRLRRGRGLSQGQLAANLGVRQQTVSKWELGKAVVPRRHLPALAAALEVEPAVFVQESLIARTQEPEVIVQSGRQPQLELVVGGGGSNAAPTEQLSELSQTRTDREYFWTAIENRSAHGPLTDAEITFYRDLGRNIGFVL